MNPRTYPVAAVVKVVDGDTVDLDVDLGFHIHGNPLRFRLKGVNCAEMGTPGGAAAKRFTVDWLAARGSLFVTSWKSPGAYGRWEGVITEEGTTGSLNADLVAAGLATRA